VVRISGDASVAGQLRKTSDGRVECEFPDRMVMIANHQVRHRVTAWINADCGSYTLTGYTSGGLHTQINLGCTGISTLFLKNL
jgi:hypothetical protein